MAIKNIHEEEALANFAKQILYANKDWFRYKDHTKGLLPVWYT